MTNRSTNSLITSARSISRSSGFSLIELLTVIGIFTVMTAMVVLMFSGIKGGQDVTKSAYELAGLLEQARSHALANNTYVWMGFFEEDGNQPSANPAVAGDGGRIVVSMVASQDGSRYDDSVVDGSLPGAFGENSPSNTVQLAALGRLVKLNNLRMVSANASEGFPNRPNVPVGYQMGDPGDGGPDNARGAFALHENSAGGNPTTFAFPLGASNPQYVFSKIIEFNPRGEASKIAENVFVGPGPPEAIEIALVPIRGDRIDPNYADQSKVAAAVQIEGMTGHIRVFRE